MKISIIIPARDEEDRIAAALGAVMAQEYPDFEVVVVDNGSADKTAEIARTFPPVKVVREERVGTMHACERGRRECAGDIIVRMDADCLPEKDWLAKGAEYFNNPLVAAVTGPYDYHDGGQYFRIVALILQRYVYRFINWLMQRLGVGAVLIGGNSFMRASALVAADGFNTAIVFYGDDTDTAKRLAQHGMVVFDPALTMKTSARRFKKEGVIRLEARYIKHFFRISFSPRPSIPHGSNHRQNILNKTNSQP